MKKLILTAALAGIAYLLYRVAQSWLATKQAATEQGKNNIVNGIAGLIWNARAPVVAQVGKKPLTGASVNPVNGFDNPYTQQTARQDYPKLAGSWSGSSPADADSILTNVVNPQGGVDAWSPGQFDSN
jgi:hypothetical protein